jgi:hypothetical protein
VVVYWVAVCEREAMGSTAGSGTFAGVRKQVEALPWPKWMI